MDNQIVVSDQVALGSLQVQPGEVIRRASAIATELADVINNRKLYTNISGKKYVRVDGWTTLGAMLGVLAREVSVSESEAGDIEAVVELIRASDGVVIGRGSALLGSDENTWKNRPHYARRSMAITRATGKAFRLTFSWIIGLAGYETTPAEEMDYVDSEVRPVVSKPVTESKPEMSLAMAELEKASDGTLYKDIDTDKLTIMVNAMLKKQKEKGLEPDKVDEYNRKIAAARAIIASRGA
jgi:hypothetical protein